MSLKNIDEYTVERLKLRCKREGHKGYGGMNKEQLYAYCVLEKDRDEVLGMRPKAKASPLKTKPSKWGVCVSSERDAKECVDRLVEKYPGIFKDLCEPVVEGPASGLIVEGKKVIGIANSQGELLAVEGNVAIPTPPPPPPMPGIHKPSPPLKVSVIPEVQIPKGVIAKKALKKDLAEARTGGMIVEANELKEQFKKLRKVQEAEIIEQRAVLTKEGGHMAALLSAVKKHKAAGTSTMEHAIEKERQRTRDYLQSLAEAEDPREAMKTAVKKGVKLKKTKACPQGQVYDGKKRKCVECSEYGMVYDPRIKRCVAVEGEVEEVKEQTPQLVAEGAIGEALVKMEEAAEGAWCVIM